MPTALREWTVLPHGPWIELAHNLRYVEGTLPGMSLRRNMTVARLPDGRLLIHNAIALDESAMQSLESFGTPAFLVVPNGWHRLDAPSYKRRYPQLRVFSPQGSRKKVEQVVAVDGTYEDFAEHESVRLERLQGVGDLEGVMLVRSPDGVTVVLADAVFNMDRKRDLLGFLFTTLLGSAPGPRISRLTKLVLVKDRKALRADLERLAALPGLVRVVVAHEKIASGPDAAQVLQKAATFL